MNLAGALLVAVLIGATGSLLIQLQQWLRIDPGAAFWLFVPAPPRRFFANMGQPNQLASLLWLGVLFVLSVYYFPTGVVGKLRARSERAAR